MGDMISFENTDGSSTEGYLVRSGDSRKGIIVLQEWWGLNDQIKSVADRFAVAGYTALAPDLYKGRVTQDPDEANHMMTGLDWVGATEIDVNGALAYLKSDGGCETVGVMGFCMGGALTVIAGVKLDACDAGVCYYGIPPVEEADPANMRVPFQGHFASLDDWCTPAAADALEAALPSSGVAYEMHRYEAEHAFFTDTLSSYDAASAELSWQRTLDFLGRHL